MTSLADYTSHLGELKKCQRLPLYRAEHLLFTYFVKQDKTWFTYRNFYTCFVFSNGDRNTGAVTANRVKKRGGVKKNRRMLWWKTHLLMRMRYNLERICIGFYKKGRSFLQLVAIVENTEKELNGVWFW